MKGQRVLQPTLAWCFSLLLMGENNNNPNHKTSNSNSKSPILNQPHSHPQGVMAPHSWLGSQEAPSPAPAVYLPDLPEALG